MKINELTEGQLCVIAESKPDWMANYRPGSMADNRPEWMADNRPYWMLANRTEWMADNRPNYGADADEVPVHIMALLANVENERT